MPSIFDLMPASFWPVQPFMPPPDPTQAFARPSASAPSWTLPPIQAPAPPSWPTAPDADTSVSAWDRAMREAIGMQGRVVQGSTTHDPDVNASAPFGQPVAGAARAPDVIMWPFGSPQAWPMRDTMLSGASPSIRGAPWNVFATRSDASPSPIRASTAADADALPPVPADTDQPPDLGAAYGNRNIARQGVRARATAAMRPQLSPRSALFAQQPGSVLTTAGGDLFPMPLLLNGGFPTKPDQLPWSTSDKPAENAMRAARLLGILTGWDTLPDEASLPAPTASPGVVPKAPLPPAFKLPPLPPPPWQLPEPDWTWRTPSGTEIVYPARGGASINPGDVVNPLNAVGRLHRDLARVSDFLLPGSGNVVSGDWDHFSANDGANLGLSVARNLALSLLGPEGAGARAVAEAAEISQAAGAAQAARAAASRGTSARATGPFVGKLNELLQPRTFPVASRAASAVLPYVDEATIPLVPYDAASALVAARRRGIDLDALSEKARDFHSALDSRAQKHRTTAALLTDGPTIIGGGAEKDLEEGQRRLLRDGEIYAELPGADAEVTALTKAMALFHRPRALATTRPICGKCQKFIKSMGGIVTSDTTAVFPPY